MKRLFSLLAVAGALMLGGCEDELDQAPISNGSVPTFYKTAADFEQALTSVYNGLRGYPDRALIMSELRSDNMYAFSTIGGRDWDGINNFATTISINPYVADTWSSDYSTIFRANTVIDQLAENGAVAGSLRNRYEAEAKFLRAFMYLDLVRYFGRVPLIDHALSPKEVQAVPRTEVSKVYDLIIADLQYAISNLPASYTGSNIGRATAGAAKGMLALVYMTRSGPTYSIDGPGQNSNEYSKALTLLNEIIAATGTARYSLITAAGTAPSAYGNVFSYTNENNAEVVFDIQYIANGTLGAGYPGLVIPDTYFTLNGVPYASGAVEIKPASADLVSSYPTGDPRRTFTFVEGYTYQNQTENRPFYKKYFNAAGKGANRTDWPINFIVMRYADILMMKAECQVRNVGGGPADAAVTINPVRARAGLAPLATIDLPGLMEERRREFAGEALRWHDLTRSGLVLTTMNAWILKEDTGGKIRRPLTGNDVIYPVPRAEMSAAPGLYEQNPGYDN